MKMSKWRCLPIARRVIPSCKPSSDSPALPHCNMRRAHEEFLKTHAQSLKRHEQYSPYIKMIIRISKSSSALMRTHMETCEEKILMNFFCKGTHTKTHAHSQNTKRFCTCGILRKTARFQYTTPAFPLILRLSTTNTVSPSWTGAGKALLLQLFDSRVVDSQLLDS